VRRLNNAVEQAFPNHTFSVRIYGFERRRSNASSPKKMMIVIIKLDPIFAFGCSPTPQIAKTLEIVQNFPYLGHLHTSAPTSDNLLEQSSSIETANLSVSVNVFRKNEALLGK
jgi:hypothetical protein